MREGVTSARNWTERLRRLHVTEEQHRRLWGGGAMGQTLGVEVHTGVAYEPGTGCWREVWPAPIVSMALFIASDRSTSDRMPELTQCGTGTYLFREDSFDATTRIRRGRFYQSNGNINNTRVRFRDATEATASVHHFFMYGLDRTLGSWRLA